jgi:DEAD/DEAH box helicase domain-containing protein
MPDPHAILSTLQRDRAFQARVTAWERTPARPAHHAPWPASLDARLVALMHEQGIHQPYSHQAQAIAAALRNENTLVVTPTASGKTLAYHLPVLHWLLANPDARALYIFPTKALAQDQRHTLQKLLAGLPGSMTAAIYDGDTPKSQRKWLREHSRIIFTNPDMLHTGILPHHPAWGHFFGGLRAVIMDEIHSYRGVFGSHVANVLRRLQRITNFYRQDAALRPELSFLMASATIANPAAHARRLIEKEVTVIAENGAPAGERHFIFVNPPLVNPELGLRRSNLLEAQQLGVKLLRAGLQTIFFARSRMGVELLLTYLREALARQGDDDTRVVGYRGGYLPGQRRKIEQGLRSGQVQGVVATNALELGIDIGALQAAVLVGFPGSIASVWQQAGRAGRGQQTALGLFVAGGGALDQYIVQHPSYFFGRSPEHALINPDNLLILTEHLRCALFELPFRQEEAFGQFAFSEELLQLLAEMGEAQCAGDRWFWMSEAYPASEVSLRTASPDGILILAGESGEALGEMDRETAPSLLHPGAIYLHQGRAYQVQRLDWDAGHAWVTETDVDYYTRAITSSHADILTVRQQVRSGAICKGRGDLVIRRQVTGYRRIKRWTHETLRIDKLAMPEQRLETTGYWLSITPQLVANLRELDLWQGDANDYGPTWPEQRQKARARDGYRCTLCGTPERAGHPHDVHHVQPFRSFGYRAGVNRHDKIANRLENLRTLCRACHRQVERSVRLRSGLGGLAYLLSNLAPLHLMCDPGDLGYLVAPESKETGQPTIILYDQAPGGIGLAEHLFDLQRTLLHAAQGVVARCSCQRGCPACVGPVSEGAEALDWDAKALTRALLDAILETI